jgi:hypothetical protein
MAAWRRRAARRFTWCCRPRTQRSPFCPSQAVLRSATGSFEIAVVAAQGGKTEKSPAIPVRADWLRGSFVGASAAQLHLCLGHGEIYAHQPSGTWVAVEAPGGDIASCALTARGELWAVHGGSPAMLSRRVGSGWERVECLRHSPQPASGWALERRPV